MTQTKVLRVGDPTVGGAGGVPTTLVKFILVLTGKKLESFNR